jgi:hypothetical protein
MPQPRSKYDGGREAAPVLERILARCVVNERGCWIWQGCYNHWGYGQTKVGSRRDGSRRSTACHIATYEAKYGPVPDGLTLDHVVCDTRICCNPDHVVPATMRDNTLRSATAPTAINARKTHCVKGHPLNGENLRFRPDNNGRVCRTCQGWKGL